MLGAAFSAPCAVGSIRAAGRERTRKPNIIIILADDMGYGDVGYHGIEDVCTPNIDALAAGGVRFSQGYVTASVCGPSRCGLLTGVYQQRLGCAENPPEKGFPDSLRSRRAGLPASQPILPEMLATAGYHCGIVGKWHLGLDEDKRPLKRGFDEFYGFLNGAHSYYESGMKFAKNPGLWPIFRGDKPVKFEGYLTDVFTDEAVDFIKRNSSKPFFLYLSYNAVHGPWQVPDAYVKRLAHIPGEHRRFFAAMVLAMDDGIGRISKTLTDAGLDENTVIIFVSDNGTPYGQKRVGSPESPRDCMSSTGPLRGFKGDTYEGGIRVPFVIRWPGRLPAGKQYDLPVSTIDVTPTLTAYLGIDRGEEGFGYDGVDLMPYLTGKGKDRPHEIMYWRRDDDYAIRRGDWKLAFNDGRPTGPKRCELFNLADDMGEQHDLSRERPEIVGQLQRLFDAWDSKLPDSPWRGAPANRKQN